MESKKDSNPEKPAQPASPKGISINIGLNQVDPAHYDGWSGELAACEFDARDLQAIAQQKGFISTLLLTSDATSEAVIDALSKAAGSLYDGDILLLTYSGHGSQVPDTNNDEIDELDETWVLYDRQLVDDELFTLFSKFRAGVRILVVSDSCHSGTVARVMEYRSLKQTLPILPARAARVLSRRRAGPLARSPEFAADASSWASLRTVPRRVKSPPPAVRYNTYHQNQKLYDGIQEKYPKGDKVQVQATVILISGCQDNQLSSDGFRNGLFTGQLRRVWRNGAFTGNYRRFHRLIRRRMPAIQSPNYFTYGAVNENFENEIPFTI
jgi:hypothetical protein